MFGQRAVVFCPLVEFRFPDIITEGSNDCTSLLKKGSASPSREGSKGIADAKCGNQADGYDPPRIVAQSGKTHDPLAVELMLLFCCLNSFGGATSSGSSVAKGRRSAQGERSPREPLSKVPAQPRHVKR